MNVNIELTEKDLRRLVANHIYELAQGLGVKESDIKIEVKSKQNYKSEWEEAAFRVVVVVRS